MRDDLSSINREEKKNQGTEKDVENEIDEDIVMEEHLPPTATLINQLDQLEKAAVQSQVDDGINHSHQMRNALRKALSVHA